MKIFLETNENGITVHQNLYDTIKAVLREKFTGINAPSKKQKDVK
jgi:hypothetical protein